MTDFGDNVGRVVPARSGRFYGKAMRAGNIYIVAGNGHRRFTGDGGPATSRRGDLGPAGGGRRRRPRHRGDLAQHANNRVPGGRRRADRDLHPARP